MGARGFISTKKEREKFFQPTASGRSDQGQLAGLLRLDLDETADVSMTLLEEIRKALEENMNTGNEDLRVDLGVALNLLGRPEKAIAELRTAEANQDVDAQYHLGWMLLKEKRSVKVWDAVSGKLQYALKDQYAAVTAVAFSPDGQHILTGSADGKAMIWDARTSEAEHALEGHQGPVLAVAFSPDGKHILTGSADGKATIWDAGLGEVRHTLEGHQDPVLAVAFSPDGKHILTGSADGKAMIWDAETGEMRHALEGHQGLVNAVAFSPDGHNILTGSNDKTVSLWDAGTGKLLRTSERQQGPVLAVAFSPDGRSFVTGSDDQTLQLWDTGTGEIRRILKGHQGPVHSIAFSPDGRWLLSGSADHTVKIWDAGPGDLRSTLEGLQGPVASVAFSPDGRYVLTGSSPKISWTGVVNHLRRAIDQDPGNIPAYYYLGKAVLGLVQDESLKDAVDSYSTYLAAGAPIGRREEVQAFLNSQDKELQKKAAVERGQNELEDGRYPESIAAFEEAIRLGDQMSYFHMAQVFQKTGNYLRAVDAFRQTPDSQDNQLEWGEKFRAAVGALFTDWPLIAEAVGSAFQAASGMNEEEETEVIANEKSRLLGIAQSLDGYCSSISYSLFLDRYTQPHFVYLHGDADAIEALEEAWNNGTLNLGKRNITFSTDNPPVESSAINIEALRKMDRAGKAMNTFLLSDPSANWQADNLSDIESIKRYIEQIVFWKQVQGLTNQPGTLTPGDVDFSYVLLEKGGNRVFRHAENPEFTLDFRGREIEGEFRVRNRKSQDLFYSLFYFSHAYGNYLLRQGKLPANDPDELTIWESPQFITEEGKQEELNILQLVISTEEIDTSLLTLDDLEYRDTGAVSPPLPPSPKPLWKKGDNQRYDWFQKTFRIKLVRHA